jgi:hypothetical protein
MEKKQSIYRLINKTIKEVEDLGYNQKSVEWYRDHYTILKRYRLIFDNFNNIDIEITNIEFRKTASLLENLIKRLINDFEKHGWFGLYDYIKLNRSLLFLTDYSLQFHKEHELSSLLKNLKVC